MPDPPSLSALAVGRHLNSHRRPGMVIKTRRIPTGHGQAGIQLATHQQISVAYGTKGCLPALVRDDNLRAAIRQFNDKLCQEARPAAVDVASAEMRKRARIPTVTQNGAQGIAALANLRGHIISLVVNALAELRPAGRQHIVADQLSIEMQLVHSQRSDINHGPLTVWPTLKSFLR